MPLEAPQLDTRTFEDLKRAALLRIPRYAPEWTDFNESDPGVTLLELFAWLTELMLYEMNRVPDRSYIKLLQLLGAELRPAIPARAHLTFTVAPGTLVRPVLPRTRIGAQPADGGDALIFETRAGLDLIRLPLSDVQVFDGSGFAVVTTANATAGPTFLPFGWNPQPGNALYLGFAQSDPAVEGRIFPGQMSWRLFLPVAQLAGMPVRCEDASAAPTPPVSLAWEYRAAGGKWRRVNVFKDDSVAFTREGAVLVEGPAQPIATIEGRIAEPRFWLRVRIDGGAYPAGLVPTVDFIRPNVVEAENLSTVRSEFLGTSEGVPGQVFALRFRPVEADSLELIVADPEGNPETWTRVQDFLASDPDDRHYVLNPTRGEIRFGDGRYGLIPPAGLVITAQHYRYGGGRAGNVPAGAINAPLTALSGVDAVINERPAAGGRDEQSIDEFKRQAPAELRHQDRAITAGDFIALAQAAGGIAKATSLPLFHPDHPGIQVPGAITLVVVPDNDDVPPRPSPDQLDAVCRYLESRRMLTTELYVKGPEFIPVRVEARVEVEPYAAFDAVAQEIIASIDQFLDPLGRVLPAGAGAPRARRVGTGRDIGLDLHPTALYGLIQRHPMVKAVPFLAVRVNGQPHEPVNAPIRVPADGMVYGAPDHEIVVAPYSESEGTP